MIDENHDDFNKGLLDVSYETSPMPNRKANYGPDYARSFMM